MKIAIQGEKGSFHDAAAHQFFGEADYSLVSCDSFLEVFKQLASQQADYGVVAAENSLFGSIHETYDCLLRHSFPITGEVSLPIHQQLIAHHGVALTDIKEVISHPAALDQCREFLEKSLPNAKLIKHADTAGAVADIATKNLRHSAAIASERAASLHNMEVIASDIEDEPDNITRFIVLRLSTTTIPNSNKASLLLTTPHTPGALHEALGVFTNNDSNLTKIESRPVRGKPFQYQFIIDAMASQDQLISLTHELEQLGCQVTLLGHYRAASKHA